MGFQGSIDPLVRLMIYQNPRNHGKWKSTINRDDVHTLQRLISPSDTALKLKDLHWTYGGNNHVGGVAANGQGQLSLASRVRLWRAPAQSFNYFTCCYDRPGDGR